MAEIELAKKFLTENKITPSVEINKKLFDEGIDEIHNVMPIAELLRRPNVTYAKLEKIFDVPKISANAAAQVEISFFYEGYIKKQVELAQKFETLEDKILPDDIDYNSLKNLRVEAREKLTELRPRSIGQASRISGVSPADISVLIVWLETLRRK